MKLIKLFCFTCWGIFYLTSCDKNDPIPDNGTIVESIEATINFDLSARKDWKLYVGGKRYQFTINGNTLSASPENSSKPFVFPTSSGTGKVQLLFYPNNYGKTRDESTPPPNLEKQETPDKFMVCDMLKAEYSGAVSQHLKDITLYHENTLLDFKVTGVPENARIYISQLYYQAIKPLRSSDDPTAYKAIVFPYNNFNTVYLGIEIEGKIYSASLNTGKTRMPSYPDGLGNSAIISFHAFINEQGNLIIENLERKSFSKSWPINQ